MLKSYLLLVSLILLISATSLAQLSKSKSSSESENNEPKNLLDISLGIGNGAFSSDNKSLNSTGFDNQIIFTPSVVYHLKSGFSFGATAYLANDTSKNPPLYQTGLSAAYDYTGKDVEAGISYTHFLTNKNQYNSLSLYQNDVYSYVKKAKGIIQPGLALGYSNGQYKQYNFARVVVKRPLNPRGDTTFVGNDSTSNKASFFSTSISFEHDFSFASIFNADDELDFIPALIFNNGTDALTQTHSNKIFTLKALNKKKKVDANNKFQFQSVATSFDLNYSISKFFIQSNLYLDYYVAATTAKRWTAIYSLSVGYTF